MCARWQEPSWKSLVLETRSAVITKIAADEPPLSDDGTTHCLSRRLMQVGQPFVNPTHFMVRARDFGGRDAQENARGSRPARRGTVRAEAIRNGTSLLRLARKRTASDPCGMPRAWWVHCQDGSSDWSGRQAEVGADKERELATAQRYRADAPRLAGARPRSRARVSQWRPDVVATAAPNTLGRAQRRA